MEIQSGGTGCGKQVQVLRLLDFTEKYIRGTCEGNRQGNSKGNECDMGNHEESENRYSRKTTVSYGDLGESKMHIRRGGLGIRKEGGDQKSTG